MNLTIIQPDYSSPEWEALPGDCRKQVRELLEAMSQAPDSGLTAWMKSTARELATTYPTFRRKFYAFRNSDCDWMVLIDNRKSTTARAANSLARQPHFIAELLRLVEKYQRKNNPAFRHLKRRWLARKKAIPGYEDWQGWPQIPDGWTDRNLARIVAENSNKARLASIRIGTSSKTNPYLPQVLTTRCGLHHGAVIQIDDVWHDSIVTYGKSRAPVRVLELGALDLFSACRIHFGARPRRKKESGGYEGIAGADMRLFLAGLLNRTGYSPQGTMFMSEHATAKISDDIARILYDSTQGMIRVDYQPIEGKQAALSGFWSGTEGGNFRAKAALESSHALIHNDLSALPVQTGSPSSGLKAPVTSDRIVAYINRILKTIGEKSPERLDQLQLPTWDFHTQFMPFLMDYYHFGLNARTDHDIEGWEKLGHVINEYTTLPGSGLYISEGQFLALPDTSRAIISSAAKADPQSWTRRRNLSPNEVWNKRPKFLPIAPSVLCDILTADLAREVTAQRGFLTFSDQAIATDPLVFTARYCSGPQQGREIPHGEKIAMFANPFDDTTAMVVDSKLRYLGQVPLYKRLSPIDMDAFGSDAPYEERPDLHTTEFKAAAGFKHQRIADILEPSRIAHADEVQAAKDLRAHNRRLISGEAVTDEERSAARSLSAQKGQRTAATNRLAHHGEIIDWDHAPQFSAADPFADLPDDEELPDAL